MLEPPDSVAPAIRHPSRGDRLSWLRTISRAVPAWKWTARFDVDYDRLGSAVQPLEAPQSCHVEGVVGREMRFGIVEAGARAAAADRLVMRPQRAASLGCPLQVVVRHPIAVGREDVRVIQEVDSR